VSLHGNRYRELGLGIGLGLGHFTVKVAYRTAVPNRLFTAKTHCNK
jgi:hypothetical protein